MTASGKNGAGVGNNANGQRAVRNSYKTAEKRILAETITHDEGNDEMMRVLELEGSTQVAKAKTTLDHAFAEHEYAVVPEASNFSPTDNDDDNDSSPP